jgi:drug/metabolite transporter (DMT)-like permease
LPLPDSAGAGKSNGQQTPTSLAGAAASAPVPSTGWTEAALLLMVLVWGVNFAVVKQALASFEPLAFNAIRFLIASLFVYVVLRVQGSVSAPDRKDVPRVIALGLAGNVLYQMAFILGLDLTLAGHASLMLATTPIFTAVLSAVAGHERPGVRTWVGASISFLGVGLVSGGAALLQGMGDAVWGDLILVGAALVWAMYTVGARPIVRRYGSVRTTAWTLWVGTIGLVIAGAPSLATQNWIGIPAGAWGGLLFSACFAIGLAYLIWYRGVERIGNTRTAIFSNLTPLVALAFAAVWIGERLTATSIGGATLVLGGVMLVRSDSAR